jgi:hypothetical protein
MLIHANSDQEQLDKELWGIVLPMRRFWRRGKCLWLTRIQCLISLYHIQGLVHHHLHHSTTIVSNNTYNITSVGDCNDTESYCSCILYIKLYIGVVAEAQNKNKTKAHLNFHLLLYPECSIGFLNMLTLVLNSLYCKGTQIFQKSRNHLKILGTRRMTWSKFHPGDLEPWSAIVWSVVTQVTLYPGIMRSCCSDGSDNCQTNLRVMWLCIFIMTINEWYQRDATNVIYWCISARHVLGVCAHHQEH